MDNFWSGFEKRASSKYAFDLAGGVASGLRLAKSTGNWVRNAWSRLRGGTAAANTVATTVKPRVPTMKTNLQAPPTSAAGRPVRMPPTQVDWKGVAQQQAQPQQRLPKVVANPNAAKIPPQAPPPGQKPPLTQRTQQAVNRYNKTRNPSLGQQIDQKLSNPDFTSGLGWGAGAGVAAGGGGMYLATRPSNRD